MQGPFIAIDWGTTNRRVYRIGEDGRVQFSERDSRGVTAVEPGRFPEEAAEIRAKLGDLPMICAGMAGSDRGWARTAYLPCPADLPMLAAGIAWLEPGRTAILPGVSLSTPERVDTMRGEEVQFLGAVAAGLAPADALLCQPGTHCKWARLEGGRIASFTTAIAGELFALLKSHSLLSPLLSGEVTPGAAFLDGVRTARRRDLLSSLFEVRAAVLLGRRSEAESAAYLSGLLVGSDIAAHLSPGDRVDVLADPSLGALYHCAIEAGGGHSALLDSHVAFVHGIREIWRLAAGERRPA